jgi:oxygen-independent coproporphyrinogen-3 oxidase
MDAYVLALKAELSHARREIGPLSLRSLYLGGGTPTVLPTAALADILGACADVFALAPDTEITCECNPGTVDAAALRELKAAGVNRLSIGVQSLRDDELRFLERVHSAAEGRETVLQAREAGFERVSLDLIYCLPGQTRAAWEATLAEAVALAPDHISAYCLQIEEGTPLAERLVTRRWGCQSRHCLLPMPDDEQADLYACTTDLLAEAGFAQYEVSSYARPGAQCNHNLTYWHNEPYLGVGASAWSFIDGERRQNVADVEDYIGAWEAGEPAIAYREHCVGAQAANETLMMGLRLCEGIDLTAFRERHGVDLVGRRRTIVDRLVSEGLATLAGGRLALTTAGLAIAAEITAALALGEEE